MRLLMFGTGPFAVPTFECLLQSAKHEVAALVTRPIADAGKRRKSSENPTRDVAEARGIPILDPIDVNRPEIIDQLTNLAADLFVVCDYGQILSRDCLGAAPLGGINLHGSLLPRYRGAAPINWAIFHGDTVTGITIIHMTPKLDGGPCLVKRSLPIEPDQTAADLEPPLAQLGTSAVLEAIEMLADWDGQSPIGELQDPALATRAPRLKKSDGRIDWQQSAIQLANQVRAFQPWPGSYTEWTPVAGKPPVRLIVHRALVVDDLPTPTRAQPGEVLPATVGRLIVQTGAGALSLEHVQPAGKRAMPIADYLRGHAPEPGDRFQ